MTDRPSPGRSGQAGAWAGLVLGSAAIFIRVAAKTHSVALGLLALLGLGVFIVGLVVWSRRRAARQIEASVTGQLRIELGLDFACLPGQWPERARETLNAAGAGPTPSLTVVAASAEALARPELGRVGAAPLELAVGVVGPASRGGGDSGRARDHLRGRRPGAAAQPPEADASRGEGLAPEPPAVKSLGKA